MPGREWDVDLLLWFQLHGCADAGKLHVHVRRPLQLRTLSIIRERRLGRGAAGSLLVAMLSLALAQAPQFRSSVTQIEVDVSVTDGDGNFVSDLGRDDFEILEDGQPQVLTAFSLIDVPVTPPAAVKEALATEGDVTTNTDAANGRLWVMLLDIPTTPGGGSPIYTRRTQNVARRFVEEAMGPNDSMAVIHVHGTMRQSQPLTRSRRLLLDSIEQFVMGAASVSPETGMEQVTRTTNLFRLIEELSGRLGALSGRRTAVLWFGGGISFNLETYPTLAFAYRDAIRAAQRNNVAIYAIDPGGLGTK